jgi:hypothetical protein
VLFGNRKTFSFLLICFEFVFSYLWDIENQVQDIFPHLIAVVLI